MRPNQKRGRGLSPLVIRALGVLAIMLMAMSTPPTSSGSVPNCSQCPPMASAECKESCTGLNGARCTPMAVPAFCSGCYVYKCTKWECSTDPGGPDDGERAECVVNDELTPW